MLAMRKFLYFVLFLILGMLIIKKVKYYIYNNDDYILLHKFAALLIFKRFKFMQSFRIIVYLNENAKTDNNRVFERFLPVVSGVKIDFECLLSSMRILFGSGCIVVFELA